MLGISRKEFTEKLGTLKTSLEATISSGYKVLSDRLDSLPTSLTEYAGRINILEEWAEEATGQYDEQERQFSEYDQRLAQLEDENKRLASVNADLSKTLEGVREDVLTYLKEGLDPKLGSRTDGEEVDFNEMLDMHQAESDDLTYTALLKSVKEGLGEHNVGGVNLAILAQRYGHTVRSEGGLLDLFSVVESFVSEDRYCKRISLMKGTTWGCYSRNEILIINQSRSEMARQYFVEEEDHKNLCADIFASLYIGTATKFLENGGTSGKTLGGEDFKLVGNAFNNLMEMPEFKGREDMKEFGTWLLDNYSVPGMDTIQAYLAPVQ